MTRPGVKADALVCLLLVVVTLAVYWQVAGFGFVVADDPLYVKQNAHVLEGLTADSVRWAFVSFDHANWHPLTWISLMADAQIGGGAPGTFHVTNMLLHILNALLLFALLRFTTGDRWRSAAVAMLFALHPLHVESVAWVTERKDTLSTLFWLLTMGAYVWYAREPMLRRYLLVILAFALGLMAKPMLVSLPIVLLLMDCWPLGRFGRREAGAATAPGKSLKWLLVEKIPLVVLAAASCVVTVQAQAAGGAVGSVDAYPLGVRVANALVAYVAYIGKMFCPLNLSVTYAHPGAHIPTWQVLGSGLALLAVSAIVIARARRWPYLFVGWFWYVVTLVPVIGLVQVGRQSMADRYTYVPLIGLFVILAWGVPGILAALERAVGGQSRLPAALRALGVAVFLGLAASTYFQVGYWRDSISLFDHAVEVNGGSYLSHIGLGGAYVDAGRYADAIREYSLAARMRPGITGTHYSLGVALVQVGSLSEAAAQFELVLKIKPGNTDAIRDLGAVYALTGRVDESIACYRKLLAFTPRDSEAHDSLGASYALRGDLHAAVKEFNIALRLDPKNDGARKNLSRAEALLQDRG